MYANTSVWDTWSQEKFEGMTEDERDAVFDECFEYNDRLRANGHAATEVPLQPPETAADPVLEERQSRRRPMAPIRETKGTARRPSHP